MFALFFLISLVYNLLRCMKISLLVTAPDSGAEAVAFIKVWLVLPAAFLVAYIFTKVSSRYTRELVFYVVLMTFIAFFVIFIFILYPNREALECNTIAGFLKSILPEGAKGFIAIIRHWVISLFYVSAEFWSSLVLSMLFWGFANEVTKIGEAKRFYAIFALGANCSGILLSPITKYLTLQEYNPAIPFGNTAWEQSLFLLIMIVIVCTVIILGIFYYLNNYVFKAEAHQDKLESTGGSSKFNYKKKPKLSLKECFIYLASSRYMMYIAIMVVSYNIVYNLTDVIWSAQIKQVYSNPSDYNNYMSKITSITGIIAVFSALLISGNVIRRYGWTVTALITPGVWLVTSMLFFGTMLFDGTALVGILHTLLANPLNLIVLLGAVSICCGRASKYTVFDEAKEISFIPLPRENQRKGKAVIDGIGSRFGKSGGSLMIQILVLLCADIMLTIPYVAAILFTFAGVWIYAVLKLGKLVTGTIDNEKKESNANNGISPINNLETSYSGV